MTRQLLLSPTAQDVLTAAICNGPELEYRIAAALRAAAAATQSRQYNDCYICGFTDLLAIADELEAQ